MQGAKAAPDTLTAARRRDILGRFPDLPGRRSLPGSAGYNFQWIAGSVPNPAKGANAFLWPGNYAKTNSSLMSQRLKTRPPPRLRQRRRLPTRHDASFEPLGAPLGFDLSANASPPAEPSPGCRAAVRGGRPCPSLPTKICRVSPKKRRVSTFGRRNTSAAPVEDEPVTRDEAEEKEPISLGAFAPYQPPSLPETPVDLEPLPDLILLRPRPRLLFGTGSDR